MDLTLLPATLSLFLYCTCPASFSSRVLGCGGREVYPEVSWIQTLGGEGGGGEAIRNSILSHKNGTMQPWISRKKLGSLGTRLTLDAKSDGANRCVGI